MASKRWYFCEHTFTCSNCALQSRACGVTHRNARPHGSYAFDFPAFEAECLEFCAAQCQIVATRHCERSARLAAALPGRFLPELGPSGFSRRPLFLLRCWRVRIFYSADFYSADRALGGDVGARNARSIRARRATNSPISRVRRLRPAARVTRASSI